ncbi:MULTISPECIES: serine hydrolase domain-containing protein [unclassified Streptomyces]|uniref:serine hydrolase domain-containing protein n=1 Tax=unclassified Streptomyces TaxID=2593676 RepID=UPI002E13CF33|nr:beta-lactamase family protein [Streptomyces sp. NBC_01197]WSS50080.1 beta-lactamase family protein [Streptomyces sp. NBC_01180]
MSGIPRGGSVEDAFAEVAEAFEANFASGAEVGAGVCVYHRGRPVVNLWGGTASKNDDDPWRPGTLGLLASPTKALVAVSALLLVERGLLELDTPIAAYWPEFAAGGKENITLRMVLSHRSGVVCLDHAPITHEAMRAHTPIAEALAAARPEWEPGTAHGYHGITFGYLVSELVRRRTGLTVGRFFAREIAGPLGLDCYIGLPDQDAVHVATMFQSKAEALFAGDDLDLASFIDSTSLTYRSMMGSLALGGRAVALEAEDPSYGGQASAPSLARFMAALIGEVDGIRLLGPATLAEMTRPHSEGHCLVTLTQCNWGLGFQVPDHAVFPASAGLDTAFGLSAATGSYIFADPEYDLAFGYMQNAGSPVMGSLDDRPRRLIEAVYRSVGKAGHREDRPVAFSE